MYPYRIRVKDPVLIKYLQEASLHRAIKIKQPGVTQSLGHKIPRTIKRDGIFIKDGIFAITNPLLKLECKPAYSNKKGYDFIIKKIF